jgi:hypothetical protein
MFKAANELKKTPVRRLINWAKLIILLPKVSDKQVLALPSGTNNIHWKTETLHFPKVKLIITRDKMARLEGVCLCVGEAFEFRLLLAGLMTYIHAVTM